MNACENNNFQKSYNFNDELKKLQVHDHLCLIYETSEEWQCTISFIKFGIEKGEKCLYVVDTHTASQILGYLQEEGIRE